MAEFFNKAADFFVNAGWDIVTFLAALAAGIIIIRTASYILTRIFVKSNLDRTLISFILSMFKFALGIVLTFILAGIAHIPLTPLVSAIGAIALAVGLALKDSLSNLANGVVLMGTKPFKEGDYVEIGQTSGKVKAVKMLHTELITFDNVKIVVPNSQVTTQPVVNYTAKPTRRVDFVFNVAYSSDLANVKKVILSVLESDNRILHIPAPLARLKEQGASALIIDARAWVDQKDYWDVYFETIEKVYNAFCENGIIVPYNQLDVNLKGETK